MNTTEVKVKLGLRVKFLKPVTVAGRFEIPAGEVVRVTRVIGSNAAWVVANDGTTWAEISIGKGSCVWIREDDSEGGVWWIDSPADLADEVSESDKPQVTPAPWIADGAFINCEDRVNIAILHPNNPNKADARLIAAAPELLEALQNALRVLTNIRELDELSTDTPVFRQARAAITKATQP